MKVSNLLILFFGLVVAIPAAAESESEMVRVALRIFATEAGQEEKLVSQPFVAIRAGTTATVKSNIELTYPSEYEPGSYPKAHAKALSIDPDLKGLTETNLIVPSVPTSHVTRELGVNLTLSPKIENGAVHVDVQCVHSGLAGFVDYGSAVTYKRKGALGKERDIALTQNRILAPSFNEQLASFSIRNGSGEFELEAEEPKNELSFADFAKEFSVAQLPKLRVEVEADVEGTNFAEFSSPGSKAPVETRAFSGHQKAVAILGEEPKEVLKSLGISLQEIQIDDDQNIVATGSKAELDRLTKIIDLYESDPQIFITSKFIETSKPIENLDSSLMTDPQFQVFIRGVNQQSGVDLVSAPSVMTRPFQDAKIEVIREFIYPTEYEAPAIGEQMENGIPPITPLNPTAFSTRAIGATLAVEPFLLEDGSLQLHLRPEVSGITGMLDFSQAIHQLDVGPLGKPRLIQITKNECINPVFESVAIDTKVRITDGTTVLVGGVPTKRIQSIQDKVPVLGDLPLVGQLAKSETTVEETRFLYIAITAKIVDRAGAVISQR
ncbi:MAG: hypothetical protein AAF585_02570 [Verrucomicrobiota bacterium]